jgi:hypothetical protein
MLLPRPLVLFFNSIATSRSSRRQGGRYQMSDIEANVEA